jgi:hypothetical protein
MGCKCSFKISQGIISLRITVPTSGFSKLLMLLLLLSGQRGQTIYLMDTNNIFITEDNVQIVIGDLLKNSKPGKQLGELNFPAFTDKDLCIVNMLFFYLEKNKL